MLAIGFVHWQSQQVFRLQVLSSVVLRLVVGENEGVLQRDAIGGIVYRKATYCSDKRLALSLGGLVETFNGSCQDFAQEGRHGRRHENRAATTHSLLQS